MFYYVFGCSSMYANAIPTVPNIDPNPPGPFNLAIQDAIKQHQSKAVGHLDRLKDALGVEFSFSVDFATLHRNLPASIFKKNMGEIILDKYLGALVNNIVDFLQKYPDKRLSFILKATKKKIIFNALKVKANKPMEVLFEDGAICINLEPTEFGFLPEKTGNNLSLLFS